MDAVLRVSASDFWIRDLLWEHLNDLKHQHDLC